MVPHKKPVTSRRSLACPDEKPAVKATFESVLKFNPNHGPDGRFSSGGGGGRRGGTAGAPTSDAFGKPLRPKGGAPSITAVAEPSSQAWASISKPKQTAAAHSPQAQQAKGHLHGTSDGGYGPKGGSIESGGLRAKGMTNAEYNRAADKIKAHNDAVDKDKTTGNQDAAYDAIMTAYRAKKKRR